MIFEIYAEKIGGGNATFFYDNQRNILKDSTGNIFEYHRNKLNQKQEIWSVPSIKIIH